MDQVDFRQIERELFKEYAISINNISVGTLFKNLDQAGIVLKGRKELLSPFVPRIQGNWQVFMDHEDVFKVVTCHHIEKDRWAHQVLWRTTNNGWVFQCLASNDINATNPLLKHNLEFSLGKASQTWYLPYDPCNPEDQCLYTEKRWGKEAVREIHEKVSPDLCDTFEYHYIFVDPGSLNQYVSGVSIHQLKSSDQKDFVGFVEETEGEIFLKNEELDVDDLFLEELNRRYSETGFSRNRNIYLASIANSSQPAGAVVVYQGPFGINLRFLESKSHLIINRNLPDKWIKPICIRLLQECCRHYQSFIPGFIPVITKEREGKILLEIGAERHTIYHQHAVVPDGEKVIRFHIDGFNQRLKRAHAISQKRKNRKRRKT